MASIADYVKATRTILGKNERNLIYTLPENPKSARLIADNKLKAKKVLKEFGIPVANTFGIIRSRKDLDTFDWNSLPSSFALKPNKGFAGEGILILYGERKRKTDTEEREWIKSDGSRMTKDSLIEHIQNILDGKYSLKNAPDTAYFEERLKNMSLLKPYLYKGVPDVRVVVYNHIPVMAMLRLPTRESNGKANITIGGVGVGIDIASGITTTAIHHDKIIDVHPDTHVRLSGFSIPFWDKILEMAITAQNATGLGFTGADIALDKDMGPVMLEVNARPGLGIQIANQDSLKERMQRVSKLKVKTVKKGIRIAKELFGGEVEEEVEEMLGKKIVGLYSHAIFLGKDEQEHEVDVKIDTGAGFTSIDRELAVELGYQHVIDIFDSFDIPKVLEYVEAKEYAKKYLPLMLEKDPDFSNLGLIKSGTGITLRPIIVLPMVIEGVNLQARVTIIDRKHLKYPAIIGTKDLGSFIVDVSKR